LRQPLLGLNCDCPSRISPRGGDFTSPEELLKPPSHRWEELAHPATLPGDHSGGIEAELLGESHLGETLPLPLRPNPVAELHGLLPRVVPQERHHLGEISGRNAGVVALPVADRRKRDAKLAGYMDLPEASIQAGLPQVVAHGFGMLRVPLGRRNPSAEDETAKWPCRYRNS
jgi:hypothetical protein